MCGYQQDTPTGEVIVQISTCVETNITLKSYQYGQKPNTNANPLVLWTRNEKGIAYDAIKDLRRVNYKFIPYARNKDYSIYQPEIFPFTDKNWKILSYNETELIRKFHYLILQRKLTTVIDIFNVKQGIRTGNNNVFKISKSDFENSIPDNEKKYFRPVIDNKTIREGILTERNFVWYPYDENGLMINNERELQQKTPYFYKEVLLPNKNELIKRARKDENNWWVLSEHRAWLERKYPKLVSTEFGKSGSFAFDANGKYVIERGNAWIPKKDFNDIDFYYFYLAIFTSSFFETLFCRLPLIHNLNRYPKQSKH